MRTTTALLIARLAVGLVFLWNIQCALAFLIWPERYAAAYELSGAPGAAAVRGVGVLFLMWNVPYAAALWHPVRNRVALMYALVMQAVGLLGETFIWQSLPPGHEVLRGSLLRFIAFDGAGLVLLLVAAWVVKAGREKV